MGILEGFLALLTDSFICWTAWTVQDFLSFSVKYITFQLNIVKYIYFSLFIFYIMCWFLWLFC